MRLQDLLTESETITTLKARRAAIRTKYEADVAAIDKKIEALRAKRPQKPKKYRHGGDQSQDAGRDQQRSTPHG
jgi:hypothetical protein